MYRPKISTNICKLINSVHTECNADLSDRGTPHALLAISLTGVVPMQFAPCYCASKHGVIGFTRSMQVLYKT